VRAELLGAYIIDGPELEANDVPVDGGQSAYLTQVSVVGNQFWSRGPRNRVFLHGGMGTSFDSDPLQTHEFSMGVPFRLSAYDFGEIRGSHYYAATGGVARQIGQLPDFVGGPVYVGAWLENGDAFDEFADMKWRSNMGAGVIMDTIVGPVLLGGSWSFDGRWRTYLGVGRIFR
jgi:NTE family protein